jgi:putative Mg2+ transporter-C (MgtC) family protein
LPNAAQESIVSRLSSVPLDEQAVLVLQVSIAAVLGGIVGWERDRAGKNAGIRTHVVLCAASAFAVGLGDVLLDGSATGDRTRVLHGVITGIGFVGAGMIWTNARNNGPSGLTSAATVMLVAVIGCACGLGAPVAAVAVTVVALLTLWGGVRLEPHDERADALHGQHGDPPPPRDQRAEDDERAEGAGAVQR